MRLCPRAAVFVALSILIASSLAGLPAAQFGTPVDCVIIHQVTDMGTCLTNAIPLAGLGILLSLIFVAITYMFSEVIHIDSLRGWYQNEIKETAKSLMIIAIIISVLAIMGGIASILSNSTPASGIGASAIQQNFGNLYNAAAGYLSYQKGFGAEAFSAITGLSVGIGIIKSAELGLWWPVPIVPELLPPGAAVWFHFGSEENIYQSTIIDTSSLTGVNNLAFIRDVYEFLILPMYIAFSVQADLLPILIQVGLLIMVPIGLILRAIPFIRGIGGTLIAIGIALSLIYPTTLVALNIPVGSDLIGTTNNINTCSIGGPLFSGFLCALAALFPGEAGVGIGISSMVSIYPAFNFIQYYAYPITVQFVLLLLDAIIVITSAQQIAKILGGSIRLGVGGRLKLA